MGAYLTNERFRALTLAPASYVDAVEAAEPNWTQAQIAAISALIDARLAKRYAVPFDATNPPIAVQLWCSRIATLRLYLKRGVDATDGQFAAIQDDEQAAWAEVREAADSAVGLYELPLRGADGSQGVSRTGPLAYSEASPYTWTVKQRVRAEQEQEQEENT